MKTHLHAALMGVHILLLLILVAAVIPRKASASWPWFIVVHDQKLAAPILIRDAEDLKQLMFGTTRSASVDSVDATGERLKSRPSIEVALFWGPEWRDFLAQGGDPSTVAVEKASQAGRIFLADESEPAIFLFGRANGQGPESYRFIDPEAEAILNTYGIPTHVSQLPSDGSSPPFVALGVFALAVALALGVALTLKRRTARAA